MLISVIIPTCNRNDFLAKCLNLLAPNIQGLTLEDFEIIVTDDGKENQAKDEVEEKFPYSKWVEGPKKGPAANRNYGASLAKGDWLIFIDDDCQPDSDILRHYKKAIEDYDFKVYEGRTYADRPKQRMDEESPLNEDGGHLWSCNFMINKMFFYEIGRFNELFPYAAMEDVELRERILDKTKIKFIYSAGVLHTWRKVDDPVEKFRKAIESVKHYLKIRPKAINEFNSWLLIKQLLSSFVKRTLVEAYKFKFKGWKFAFQYHIFQIKLILLSKNIYRKG